MAEFTFDVVFIDCGTKLYYDSKSLENIPLGGTESSLIRIAEGLAALPLPNGRNLNVAVIRASDELAGIEAPRFDCVMGQYCYFLDESYIPRIDTKYLVCLRGPKYLHNFPKATKFIWCHDLGNERMKTWMFPVKETGTTIVAVSKWHKNNIKQFIDYDKITYVYNPIDDKVYNDTSRKVDPNLMVWAASPHKGLDEALGTYKKIYSKLPNMKLLIYNPGYMKGEYIANPGVLYNGPTAGQNVRHNMRKALCTFYPTKFEDTFGLVAAESNAVGTVTACYASGALPEIIGDNIGICKDEDALIGNIEQWHKHGPPNTIKGRPEFKTSNVIQQWLRTMAGQIL